MSWRNYLRDFLSNSEELKDCYQWGVYTAQSIRDIQSVFDVSGVKIRRFYGFDSFSGLPSETAEPVWDESWREGNYNAQTYFNVNSVAEAVRSTYNFCKIPNLLLIPGFYDKVLTPQLAIDYVMKPAIYVDIDVDIYSSALTVLDWMFANKLIRAGTLVGFDDWGTPNYRQMLDGESRAWREMTEKYDISYTQVFQLGSEPPYVHTLMRVD